VGEHPTTEVEDATQRMPLDQLGSEGCQGPLG
jgi:hypothetical protein